MPDSSSCRTGPKSTTRPSRISSASSRGAASTTRFALLGASDQTDVSTKTFTAAAVASCSRTKSRSRSYRRVRLPLLVAGAECIPATLRSRCPFWSGGHRLSGLPPAKHRRSLSSLACVEVYTCHCVGQPQDGRPSSNQANSCTSLRVRGVRKRPKKPTSPPSRLSAIVVLLGSNTACRTERCRGSTRSISTSRTSPNETNLNPPDGAAELVFAAVG